MLKKNENFLSIIVKAGMPVVAIVGLILSQFVTFGAEFSFGVTNTTKMVICAVALFFFYVPIRDIFLQYFNGGERTKDKVAAYEDIVNFACDNRTKEFKAFCVVEYNERKKSVIDAILRNTDYTFETFGEKYRFDKEAVKADDQLSKRERRAMLAAVREERKIKPESVDTILPSGKKRPSQHRRVTSNPDALSRRTLAFKSVTSVISCVVFVSIGLSLVDGTSAVEVATTVIMLVGLCLWQAFSAFSAARQINNALCNQLAEKTMFLLEFKEYLKRHPQFAAISAVQPANVASEVNVPYARRDCDFPQKDEEDPNYILTLTKN